MSSYSVGVCAFVGGSEDAFNALINKYTETQQLYAKPIEHPGLLSFSRGYQIFMALS